MPHIVENRGRPSKICPEARKAVMQGVMGNLPYDVCAWKARICEATLYNWINQGKKDKAEGLITEFTLFLEDIKEAESIKIENHLADVEAKPERWQARMTILERRWPEYFHQNLSELKELKEIVAYLKQKELKDEK